MLWNTEVDRGAGRSEKIAVRVLGRVFVFVSKQAQRLLSGDVYRCLKKPGTQPQILSHQSTELLLGF